jgi:glycosyltransferase involved in cell wall biosynthesis
MAPDQFLFSILIANYNRENYLRECLNSILLQTYQNIEIVIVDDGSTDSSVEIIQEFTNKDPRIRFFPQPINRGCGSAMKKCADLALGKWFGYLGSDDVLLPEAVDILVEGHLLAPDCGIVCTTHYVCDEKLNIQRKAYGAEKIPPDESYLSYGKGITGIASFAKDFYQRTGGIDPQFKRAVDQDIYYKMEEVSKVLFIDKPTCLYRVNDQGISTKRNISKARYWFVRAKENAYHRRLSKNSVKNIDQKELNAWWSILFITKSSEAFQKWKICKGFYWLALSTKKSFFDRHIMLKIKTLFMNSLFHRVYASLPQSSK